MTALLQTRKLAVSYGGIQAVKGIDLEVHAGELVCLIGANGAGKTTTLKSLCGLLRPSSGEVLFDGRSLANVAVHDMVKQGIALVPEGRGIFGRLSVAENLLMGAYVRNNAKEVSADMERIYVMFPRLQERSGQKAGTLSGGEQQMLAIGRALMSRPKLLLLDEPSMGLAPIMVQKIFEVIRNIAAEGVTILLVEQNAMLALSVASRGYVLDTGTITLQDTAQSLISNPNVRRAYLGEV